MKNIITGITPALWSVFILVPTGRAKTEELLDSEELENLFIDLADFSQTVPFDIKTTEGQHYRRVALQRWKARGGKKPTSFAVNDGKGFAFISHLGDVCPSGFLPIPAGNVREQRLLDIYQHSEVFRKLRQVDSLHGKCGCCEYRNLCGGSRARSYALTGDFMAEEPCCIYQPKESQEMAYSTS